MFLSLSSSRWSSAALLGNEPPKSAFIDPASSSNVSGLETHLRHSAGALVAERNRKSPTSASEVSPSSVLHRMLRSNGHSAEVVSDYQSSSSKRARKHHDVSGYRDTRSANEVWSSGTSERADEKTHQFDRFERELASSTSRTTGESEVTLSSNTSDVRADLPSHLPVMPHSSPSIWRHHESDVDRGSASASGNLNSLENYSLSPLANLLTSLVATSTSASNKWFHTGASLPSANSLPISPSASWLDPSPWYNLFPGGSTVAQRHLLQVAVAAAAATAAAKATWQPLLSSDHVTSPQQRVREVSTRSSTSSVTSSNAPMLGVHHPSGPMMNGMAKRLFGCPQCRYLTDRKNNLKRHVTTMHQESAGKTLECCAVQFRSKAALRDHVTIFHGAGYTCRHCARNFCRKALLKRHLAVHSGQKDYICSRCDYATSHKSNLERHKKVHERAPYQTAVGDGDEGGAESLGSGDDEEECDFDDRVSVDTGVAAAGQHTAQVDYRRQAFCSESYSHASLSSRSALDDIVSLSHHLMSRRFNVVRSDEVFASQGAERTSGGSGGNGTSTTADSATGNSAPTLHPLAEPIGASFPLKGWQQRHHNHHRHHQRGDLDRRSEPRNGSSQGPSTNPREDYVQDGVDGVRGNTGFVACSPDCDTRNTQRRRDVMRDDVIDNFDDDDDDDEEEEEINVVDDLVN